MRDLLQKLPLQENASFVCRTYRTPYFETPWHYHPEYELILITEGSGDVLIGDYLGQYERGDIFFLGSNLPHWFRKKVDDAIGSAVVIQFNESFLGKQFWDLPEIQPLKFLLAESSKGLELSGRLKRIVAQMILQMEHLEGYRHLRMLLDCLYEISKDKDFYRHLTLSGVRNYSDANALIGKIFEYTFANFQSDIKVAYLAKSLNMSVSSFMRFFKGNTKKTYIQFLKEVRLAHACTLLAKTRKPISNICSESGYNNWTNFCRQFREMKGMSPSCYRKNSFVSIE